MGIVRFVTFSAPPDLDQAKASAGDHRRRFQAGGTVGEGAIYIERPADKELFEALLRAESSADVLSTRHIGKSSLRLQVSTRLRAAQVECASVDLGAGHRHHLAGELVPRDRVGDGRAARAGAAGRVLDAHWHLGLAHCWLRWLEDVVLVEISSAIVLFIDEVDATLSLPFSRDDFSSPSSGPS